MTASSSSSSRGLNDLNVLKKDSLRDDMRKGLSSADDDSGIAPVQGLRDLKNRWLRDLKNRCGAAAAMSDDDSSATIAKMKGDGQVLMQFCVCIYCGHTHSIMHDLRYAQ